MIAEYSGNTGPDRVTGSAAVHSLGPSGGTGTSGRWTNRSGGPYARHGARPQR